MKNNTFFFLLFLASTTFAQEYKLNGIKEYFIMGLIRYPNDELGVVYRDKNKSIVVDRLDSNLNFMSKQNIDIKMGYGDEVYFSCTNNNSILIYVYDFSMYNSSDNSKSYLMTITPDNKVIKKSTISGITSSDVLPDRNGDGYYSINRASIQKIDNLFNTKWTYNVRKDETLLLNYAIKGNIHEPIIEDSTISFATLSTGKIGNEAFTTYNFISLFSNSGTEKFRYSVRRNSATFDINIEKKDNLYYLLNMDYKNLGNSAYSVEGANLLVLDNNGKLINDLSSSEDQDLSNSFYSDKKTKGYFLSFTVGDSSYFLLTETPRKINKYVLWKFDKSFKVVDSFAFEKEDMSCIQFKLSPPTINQKFFKFLYNNVENAGTKVNEIKEIDLDLNLKTITFPKSLFKYSQNRGAGGPNSNPSSILGVYLNPNENDKYFFYRDNIKSKIIVGYSKTYDNTFYVKKFNY